eukprot:2089642-Rhodomonas_salina.1
MVRYSRNPTISARSKRLLRKRRASFREFCLLTATLATQPTSPCDGRLSGLPPGRLAVQASAASNPSNDASSPPSWKRGRSSDLRHIKACTACSRVGYASPLTRKRSESGAKFERRWKRPVRLDLKKTTSSLACTVRESPYWVCWVCWVAVVVVVSGMGWVRGGDCQWRLLLSPSKGVREPRGG